MRHGALGSALISIENELNIEMAQYPQSKYLPRPPNHEQPLRFPQNFLEQSGKIYTRHEKGIAGIRSASGSRSPSRSASVRFNDTVSVAGRSVASSHKSAKSTASSMRSVRNRIDWLIYCCICFIF